MEEIKFILDSTVEGMQKAVDHTLTTFGKYRAGKASPAMLDGIMVDYYGAPTPLSQVAGINAPDAKTIAIKPWEKSIIPEIEKAIMKSDLGVNPQNNGEAVMLYLPPMTEERRTQLAKQVKNEAENGKIGIRNVRKEMNDELKALKDDGASEDDIKRAEGEIQKYTDSYIAKIDELYAAKEKDIMTI